MQEKFNRSEHLKRLHRQRKDTTRTKAEEAIMRLLKEHKPINFNSVATEGGVAKSTLYNNPDIRERIEFLRKKQAQLPSPLQIKAEMDDNNKDALIASLQRKIKVLADENRDLKIRIKGSYSDYYKKL